MRRIIILLIVVLTGMNFGYAQKQTAKERRIQKEIEVKELIESGRYAFVAQSAIPMSGPKINLTSFYDLKVDSLNVEAWLPFFGRAYHVDYGTTDGGVKFKEKAKSINVQFRERKKIYLISMELDSNMDNYKIQISAGVGGYASLNVVSNNRQSISYYGIIEPLPDEKAE